MSIGEKIKELRKAKGMTQMELAIVIGVSPSNISAWEVERFDPTIFNCILLADVFQVTLDELCCRDFKGVK